jgi:TctA family transporter
MVTPASWNVMVPVALLGVTEAVSVMPEPKVEGLREDIRAVAVAARVTAWVTVFEVLPLSLALPPYMAVSAWEPTPNAEVV